MGERKVLNKYYPPDFDPSKIPRRRQPKNQQIKVRMMLPMSIRCSTCGNYIYQGTKFNSRKEDVIGETYLGIQIFRFYFKCTKCSAEITMKTDPQNSDYTVEAGATRNFEPWRSTDEILDEAKKMRESEEMGDAMRALENKTVDSKQEMDILSALDEMKSLQARHALIGTDEMLQALRRTAELKEKELAAEDEAALRSVVFHGSDKYVRRVDDPDDNSDEDVLPHTKKSKVNIDDPYNPASATSASVANNKPSTENVVVKPKVLFNVKPKGQNESSMRSNERKTSTTVKQVVDDGGVAFLATSQVGKDNCLTGLGSLCATYDDDSSSD